MTQLFEDVLLKHGLVSRQQLDEAQALGAKTGQRVGDALLALGHLTREQLSGALVQSLGLGDALSGRPRLGDLLCGLKYATPDQIDDARIQQRKEDGRRLGDILIERGVCTTKQVYEALTLQTHGGGSPSPQGPSSGKRRVMVVDDSPLARNFVKEGLLEQGYEPVCFEDPLLALEQVASLKPAIVLSDLEMPGVDGAELCRRLKAGASHAIPVIILTANDTEAQKVGGLRAGADDYVSKSASMDELAARIESVVRRTDETERMRKLFARYTSDAVVEEILKNPGEIVLTGEKREVTLLFADIRNFTALSETLNPEEVVTILNDVLGRLADAVLTCGGTLDKFLGDGLMAVFGAPVRREDDGLRALQAAQMMMESVRARRHPTELSLGIGINTGPVVAGNIGSEARTEYTCIGDAVNVAARLCALAGPGEILVGERTRQVVGTAGRFEDLPAVRLKGKANPVPLFRASWGAGQETVRSTAQQS